MFTFEKLLNPPPQKKYSSGHVECSFDNPAKKFLPQNLKIFHSKPKKVEKFFKLKCYSGDVECNSDNLAENFPLNVRKKTFSKTIPKLFPWTRRNESRGYQFLSNIEVTVLRGGIFAP